MGNANERQSTTALTSSLQSGGALTEEGLGALLLRLLGVYFTAWTIISGIEDAGHIVLAWRKFGCGELVAMEAAIDLARLAPELIIGIYFLIGGQWVFDKVLARIGDPRGDAGEPKN